MFPEMKTVGVFLYFAGCFCFPFGPNQNPGELGISRFGGHIEYGEEIEQCALREAKEETGLEIELLSAPFTLDLETVDSEPVLTTFAGIIKPIFRTGHNVMFFARTDRGPRPRSETKGIIFLDKREIVQLCHNEISFKQFHENGGRSIVTTEYPFHYVLKPLKQMRLLAGMIQKNPEILNTVYGTSHYRKDESI